MEPDAESSSSSSDPVKEGEENKFAHKNSLSEREVMKRQRFLQNSSFATARSQLGSLLNVPPRPIVRTRGGTVQLREFILEQRKIIASFRSQPWPMYMKIEAIRNYKANILMYVPQLGTIDAFRDKSSRAVFRERQRLKSILRTFTIWRYIIKKIEGNFGTSVGSYFRLVRWLCMLNFSTFLLVFVLVILPQVMLGHGLNVPEKLKANLSALSFFFDGEGYLFEYSVLFYGYYDSGQNETYFAPPHNPRPYIGGYKLPLAYVLVIIFIFVISGGAILYSIAKKYKVIQRSKLGKRGQYIFAWRVFAGWDYAITDPKTAETKMKQHGIALKETLFEATKINDSPKAKFQRIIIHTVTNSIVFILLFGSGYAIFVAADNANSTGANNFRLSDLAFDNLLLFFRAFQLQIVIVLRNFLIPLLFKFIALHEKYHPRTALKLRLLRLFVLYFSSLYVVTISLFILSRNCQDGNQEGICRCWETNVGQEMYKLMLIQTVTEVGSILLVEGLHCFLSKMADRYCKESFIARIIGNVEFETSVSVLKLVYGQGLILFGSLFCPFLPAIGFMRNILVFYLRTVAVFIFDSPPQAFFRVASTHNFYMAILLVTVFISLLPVGFAMIEMVPSLRCGPFRGLDSMVQIVTHDVDTWPAVVQTIVDYIQTATIIIPLIIALCVIIYYYASLANALKDVNKDLLLQLTVEQSETRKILAEHVASDRRAKGLDPVSLLPANETNSHHYNASRSQDAPYEVGYTYRSSESNYLDAESLSDGAEWMQTKRSPGTHSRSKRRIHFPQPEEKEHQSKIMQSPSSRFKHHTVEPGDLTHTHSSPPLQPEELPNNDLSAMPARPALPSMPDPPRQHDYSVEPSYNSTPGLGSTPTHGLEGTPHNNSAPSFHHQKTQRKKRRRRRKRRRRKDEDESDSDDEGDQEDSDEDGQY